AIWVDDHDLAIVKTYGKFVSDTNNPPSRPFKMYETYRQNFQEKYWLPTYTNSDDYEDGPDGQTHMRLVIRDTDFKVVPADGTAAAAASVAAPRGAAGSGAAGSPDPSGR